MQYSLDIRETRYSGFHYFVFIHHNVTELIWFDWFRRIGIRPRGLRDGSTTLVQLRKSLSALSNEFACCRVVQERNVLQSFQG